MRIDIIAVIPELLDSPLSHSMVQRARDKGLLDLHIHKLRDYGIGNYRKIDDTPFGGGAGMVLSPEPLWNCITDLQKNQSYDEVIYLTPDGERLNQGMANQLSSSRELLLICGHYKGIDQRIREKFVTREISIGDFVLSGGELPAALLVDALARLIPGVLSDETSALFDSFQDNLLAPPVYTRPATFKGMEVPPILLSGHERKIREWEYEQSLERTRRLRPDLLEEE